MLTFVKKHKTRFLLWFFIGAYILYFSYFTILRMRTLYASYFDLGIMHQTVYNTFKSLKDKDPSLILELTNPFGPNQIKRMSIHNDIILGLISPLYFIYSGPETLLVLQTVILALGALAVYLITSKVFKDSKYKNIFALIFSISYLLYPSLERANIFDFHPVTLATSFLLFMFYFWLIKRYRLSFLFFLLSLLSKEQVSLTTSFFGVYIILNNLKQDGFKLTNIKTYIFPWLIILISLSWFLFSIYTIVPYYRGSNHFALGYYGDFGDSPIRIITGILKNPYSIDKFLFNIDTLRYLFLLFGPLLFLPLFSPALLLIALPEFAINLLSNNWNMRAIIFHYTAVVTPFIFIAGIYSARKIINAFKIRYNSSKVSYITVFIILLFSILFAYFKGPLPFAKEGEIHPFQYPQKESKDVIFWANILKNEKLKISATGQLSPFFTSRRFFYIFSEYYPKSDYVVIRLNEIYNYPEKDQLIPVYKKLSRDAGFKLIFKKNELEIYKKISI